MVIDSSALVPSKQGTRDWLRISRIWTINFLSSIIAPCLCSQVSRSGGEAGYPVCSVKGDVSGGVGVKQGLWVSGPWELWSPRWSDSE